MTTIADSTTKSSGPASYLSAPRHDAIAIAAGRLYSGQNAAERAIASMSCANLRVAPGILSDFGIDTADFDDPAAGYLTGAVLLSKTRTVQAVIDLADAALRQQRWSFDRSELVDMARYYCPVHAEHSNPCPMVEFDLPKACQRWLDARDRLADAMDAARFLEARLRGAA